MGGALVLLTSSLNLLQSLSHYQTLSVTICHIIGPRYFQNQGSAGSQFFLLLVALDVASHNQTLSHNWPAARPRHFQTHRWALVLLTEFIEASFTLTIWQIGIASSNITSDCRFAQTQDCFPIYCGFYLSGWEMKGHYSLFTHSIHPTAIHSGFSKVPISSKGFFKFILI